MMLELLDNHLAKIYKAATKNMLQWIIVSILETRNIDRLTNK
jgi:hypothetical protein